MRIFKCLDHTSAHGEFFLYILHRWPRSVAGLRSMYFQTLWNTLGITICFVCKVMMDKLVLIGLHGVLNVEVKVSIRPEVVFDMHGFVSIVFDVENVINLSLDVSGLGSHGRPDKH